jgi:hypothetical protein
MNNKRKMKKKKKKSKRNTEIGKIFHEEGLAESICENGCTTESNLHVE